MKKSQKIARYILIIGLSLAVFIESGVWTSLAILLVLINTEVTSKYFTAMSDMIMQIKSNKENPFMVPLSEEEKKDIENQVVEMNVVIDESHVMKKPFDNLETKDKIEPHNIL